MSPSYPKDTVDRFLKHAEECVAAAASAPTPALRDQYAELAKVWAELAKDRIAVDSILKRRAA